MGLRRRSRLVTVALCVAGAGGFVAFTVLGVVVHANLPGMRRLVAKEVTAALADTFDGVITVERIGGIVALGVSDVDATIRTREGVAVISVRGASARVDALTTVRALLAKAKELPIRVVDLRLVDGDVLCDADDRGLLVARVFAPPHPTVPPPKDPSAPVVSFRIDGARVQHVWLHGRPAPGVIADADVTDVDLRQFAVDERALAVDLASLSVLARAVPVVGTATVSVDGKVRLPLEEEEPAIDAHVAAAGGSLSLDVTATQDKGGTRVRAQARAGEGTVAIEGVASVLGRSVVLEKARARAIDLHAVMPTLPPSHLGADVEGRVEARGDGALSGAVDVHLLPGRVRDVETPGARLAVALAGKEITVRGTVEEPGAPVNLDVRYEGGPAPVARFTVRATATDLRQVKRAPFFQSGRASVFVDGRFDLEPKRLEAVATVDGQDVAWSGGRVARGNVRAAVSGTVEALSATVDASAEGIEAGIGPVERATLHVRVRPGEEISIADLRVEATSRGQTVAVDVPEARVGPKAQTVPRAEVTGLGAPIVLSAARGPSSIDVDVDAPSIDVGAVGHLLGRENDLRRGTVALRASVHETATSRKGSSSEESLRLAARDIDAGPIKGAYADADLRVKNRRLNGEVDLGLGNAGSLRAVAEDVDVSNPDLEAMKKSVTGRLRVTAAGSLPELQKALAAVVPTAAGTSNDRRLPWAGTHGVGPGPAEVAVPTPRIRPAGAGPAVETGPAKVEAGAVLAVLDVERKRKGATPTGSLGIRTTGLRVRVRPGAPDSFDVEGMDVAVDGVVEDDRARVDVTVARERAVLATLEGILLSPVTPFIEGKRVALADVPFSASLVVPEVRGSDVPKELTVGDVRARASLALVAYGTLRSPRVSVHGSVGVEPSKAVPIREPMRVIVEGRYDGKEAVAAVAVSAARGSVAGVEGHVRVAAADLLARKPGAELPWSASVKGSFDDCPLELLVPRRELRARGALRGDFAITGIHEDARANVDLAVRNFSIARTRFRDLGLKAGFDGKNATASVHAEADGGSLDVGAELAARWGAALVPALRTDAPIQTTLVARNFPTAPFGAFTAPNINDVVGRLDGDLRARIEPDLTRSNVTGTLSLREGGFSSPLLGEPVTGATFRFEARPDGTVVLENLAARMGSGGIRGAASARFTGARFVGARGTIRLGEGGALPVVVEGEELGDVEGTLELSADVVEEGRVLDVHVTIPSLLARAEAGGTRSLQSLEPAKDVRIVGNATAPEGEAKPGAPSDTPSHQTPDKPPDAEPEPVAEVPQKKAGPGPALRATITLGKDVRVQKGSLARAQLDGEVTLNPSTTRPVSGVIRAHDGYVNVVGKRFTLEPSTVTFAGADPSNPTVVATAMWSSPDASTRVFADFRGPVKTGKLTLRSEPPLSEREIFALILMGSSAQDVTQAPQRGGAQQQQGAAASLGGALAAQGINNVISETTSLDIQAQVDTSNVNPRPGVRVGIARNVTAEMSYVVGPPVLGQVPDRYFFSIDWNFVRSWFLHSSFGNLGSSSVDLLWRHRY